MAITNAPRAFTCAYFNQFVNVKGLRKKIKKVNLDDCADLMSHDLHKLEVLVLNDNEEDDSPTHNQRKGSVFECATSVP